MRYTVIVAVAFIAGAILGTFTERGNQKNRADSKPPANAFEPFTLSRIPGGEPAHPSPDGGTFVPYTITVNGSEQLFDEPHIGPRWLLRQGNRVTHAVQVKD